MVEADGGSTSSESHQNQIALPTQIGVLLSKSLQVFRTQRSNSLFPRSPFDSSGDTFCLG